MLGDKRFLQAIRLQNFLSFGNNSPELELKSLNVFIGPNGSGKSNLIEAISLLNACPLDLAKPIRDGGGVSEWLWKGSTSKVPPIAEIDATIWYSPGKIPLRHKIAFTVVNQRFELVGETVEDKKPRSPGFFYYHHHRGHAFLYTVGDEKVVRQRELRREDLALDQSIIFQRKEPDHYPEITYLGNEYSKIKLYRELQFGRYTAPRLPQKTDLPGDFLLEDANNLVMVLNDLEHRGMNRMLLEKLQQFYGEFSHISTKIDGGTVQVFLHEKSLQQPIPATRLSDGTLRYLCLLAILCHPSPLPLICIEEPEIGLHPDIIPAIAELLVEASQKTQLIVTTHSDALIDALSDVPEAVVVCEKPENSTTMKRLQKGELEAWLEQYRLGELWRKGELGGNRW